MVMYIQCAVCGKNLYDNTRELKKNYIRHIDYYVMNDSGKSVELCGDCYKDYITEKVREEKKNEFIASLQSKGGIFN